MTGAHDFAHSAAAGRNDQRGNGHRDQLGDLVSAHGPDITGLCHASSSLVHGVAGISLSAGPTGSVPRIRFSSDAASSQLEAAQVTLDEAPCRDATATRRPVLAADRAAGLHLNPGTHRRGLR